MISVEKTGKTTDEAIEAALAELKVRREDVVVEIMESPSKALFGIFGGKDAKVRVSLLAGSASQPEKSEPVRPAPARPAAPKAEMPKTAPVGAVPATEVNAQAVELAMEFLGNVFQKMGVKVKEEISQDEEFLRLNFTGDDLGILIGRRGETLDALQYLTNLVVARKATGKVRVILDVEGYRQRREDTLVKLAQRLADKAKKTGQSVVLEPMSPHERRIIHTALQNDLRIRTHSEGEEPYRKVVISRK